MKAGGNRFGVVWYKSPLLAVLEENCHVLRKHPVDFTKQFVLDCVRHVISIEKFSGYGQRQIVNVQVEKQARQYRTLRQSVVQFLQTAATIV